MVVSNKLVSCCKCSLEYVSVACNRTPLYVDWGRNGWVAYGACYSIALYRPQVGFKAVHASRVRLRLNQRIVNMNLVIRFFRFCDSPMHTLNDSPIFRLGHPLFFSV